MFMVCAVARNWRTFSCCEDYESAFALISMTADEQLRGKDIEGFCDDPYPSTPTKETT